MINKTEITAATLAAAYTHSPCFVRLGGSCRPAAEHGQMLWRCVERA